jgi:hypothetical protein
MMVVVVEFGGGCVVGGWKGKKEKNAEKGGGFYSDPK